MMHSDIPSHGVILPFYNRFHQMADCLARLLMHALPETLIILVDDGSPTPVQNTPRCQMLLSDPRVILVRHNHNKGIAAARNTGLRICRAKGLEIVIMLDSDCEPPEDFITSHLRLHQEMPEVTGIGGGIRGKGHGIFARIDNVMSWVHAMPLGQRHEVKAPYHTPTTNFSFKLTHIPLKRKIFDERLATGEDALFTRALQASGRTIFFSPYPVILHHDRETCGKLIAHHYRWGHHQYFIQLGGDLSARCFKLWYRIPFLITFLPAWPFFAFLGSVLNIRPWLKHKPFYLLYYPFMYSLWLLKGVAVMEAAFRPHKVLRNFNP